MSTAGAFYVLAMFVALRTFVTCFAFHPMRAGLAALLGALLASLSLGWTIRAISFYADLRRSAQEARNDWVSIHAWVEAQGFAARGPRAVRMLDRLRDEMLSIDVPQTYLDPPWIQGLDPMH